MPNLIVWDLDDTLMDNVHDYSSSILESINTIVQVLGRRAPHVKEIMRIEDEIDTARITQINPKTGEQFLFSKDRFPGSLAETYRYICVEVGVQPYQSVEDRLWEIGSRAFDKNRYRKNIHPAAKNILLTAKAQGFVQVLMTKGDTWVQERKLEALDRAGLLDVFSWTEIVPQKGQAEFREVIAEFEGQYDCAPALAVSIGNSYGSDIEPALDVGFSGILVPVWNWEEIQQKDELLAKAESRSGVVVVDGLENVLVALEGLV